MPFDLTVAGAVIVLSILAVVAERTGWWIPEDMPAVVLLFAAFIPAIAFSSFNAYGVEKVSRLFTLTFLAAIAPLWLLRTRERVRLFLHWLAVIGIFVALVAYLQGPDPLVASGRLVFPGSDPIGLARFSGAALIWIAILGFHRVVPRLVALLVCAFLVGSIYASGTRGPLIAAGLASVFVAVVAPGGLSKRVVRLLGITILAVGLSWYALSQISDTLVARFALLIAGEHGTSIDLRELLYRQSVDLIATTPQGIGWGGFIDRIMAFSTGSDQYRYPHNIVLEVTLEGGWLAGAALIAALWAAWRRSLMTSDHPEGAGLFALLIYFAANALVSGDINDNRILFTFVAACLVYGRVHANQAEALRVGHVPISVLKEVPRSAPTIDD